MVNQQDNHYRTSDTALAAFLRTQNFFLVTIDYTKLRFEFVFNDSENLREAVNNYITGNALCDPSAFARVNRKLNRIIRKQVQWEED